MKLWATLGLLIILLAACSAPKQESKAKDLAEELRQQVKESTEAPAAQEPQNATTEQAAQQVESAEQAQPEQQAAPEPAQQEQQSAPEPAPQTNDILAEETTTQPQTRTTVYQFLDTFAKEVTSYQFTYKGRSYYSKGTRFKIILESPVSVKGAIFPNGTRKSLFYYDAVYVDRAAKNAIAYCEGHIEDLNRQCTKLDLRDHAYPVSFEQHNLLIPEDWLFSHLDKEPSAIEDGKYYVDGRLTTLLTFKGSPTTLLYFDEGTGLPVRADQKKDGHLLTRYDYKSLASNKVRDVDVVHRSLSEIPSEEYFYR